MVRMSDIWDRTTEVLRGRASMLATIAALLVFLPTLIQASAQLYVNSNTMSVTAVATAAMEVSFLGLLLLVIRMWGNAAIVAAGSDPAYDQSAAIAHGARRLGPLIGITFLLGVAAVLLLVPFIALVGSSLDLAALARGQVPTARAIPGGGVIAAALVYALIVFVVVILIAVRLILLVPVIVNERLGIGAIGRSWRLTRGLFWRVFGVLWLFGIVLLIASSAATLLLSLLARLLLGGTNIGAATFIGQIGAGAVASASAVVTGVFTAQLYRALTGREAAETFA